MRPDSNHGHCVVFALWLAVLYAGWLLTWCLHDLVLPPIPCRTADTAFWLLAKIVVWLLPVLWVLHREVHSKRPLEWLGLRTAPSPSLAIGAACAWLGIQLAKDLVTSTLPVASRLDAALFSALVVAPLFEETVFRGFAIRYLADGGTRPAVALGVSSVAWACLHVPGWLFQHVDFGAASIQFFGVAAFGVVLGVLRLRSQSLFVPIFVHFINNAWHQGLLAGSFRIFGRRLAS